MLGKIARIRPAEAHVPEVDKATGEPYPRDTTLPPLLAGTIFLDDRGEVRECPVVETAVVTLNGAVADFADLRPGDRAELSGKPAVSVKATRSAVAEAARRGFEES